jgi:hypothetical protein
MIIVNILDYFISILFYGNVSNSTNNYLDYFSNEYFKCFIESLDNNAFINDSFVEGVICGIILGIKSSIMVFIFI